jgi:hypothetical protein
MQELNEWDSFYNEFQEERKIAARNSAKAARNRARLKRDRRERSELREAKQKKIDDCSETIIVLALSTSMSLDSISERVGIESHRVYEVVQKNLTKEELTLRSQIAHSKPNLKMMKYTDDDIVNAIKMAAEELGPKFGVAKYANWRKSKPKSVRDKIPSQALFERRKGWRKYREMAGLETPNMKIKGMGARIYSDEDIFRTINDLVKEKGRWVKIEEAEAMTKDKPKIPKVGIMRIRFGYWENVRKAYFEWLSEQ